MVPSVYRMLRWSKMKPLIGMFGIEWACGSQHDTTHLQSVYGTLCQLELDYQKYDRVTWINGSELVASITRYE